MVLKTRFVFEQPLVNGAEFFDVERSVVHADQLAGLRVLIEAQRAKAAKKNIVAEGASAEVRWLAPKRSPASGASPELLPGPSASKSRKVPAGPARGRAGDGRRGSASPKGSQALHAVVAM